MRDESDMIGMWHWSQKGLKQSKFKYSNPTTTATMGTYHEPRISIDKGTARVFNRREHRDAGRVGVLQNGDGGHCAHQLSEDDDQTFHGTLF